MALLANGRGLMLALAGLAVDYRVGRCRLNLALGYRLLCHIPDIDG